MPGPTKQMVSWAPLERFVSRWIVERGLDRSSGYTSRTRHVENRLVQAISEVTGIEVGYVHALRRRGRLELRTADRIATDFDVFPTAIWGEEWFAVPPLRNPDRHPGQTWEKKADQERGRRLMEECE